MLNHATTHSRDRCNTLKKTLSILLILLILSSCSSNRLSINYDYNDQNSDYNEVLGDFVSVKYVDEINLRLFCRYYNGYKSEGPIIEVQVRHPKSEKIDISKKAVSVSSSKFGQFNQKELGKHALYIENPTVRFTKKVDIIDIKKVKQQLQGDKIVIKIEDKSYEFLAPNH